jgi:hypothetical protein
VRLEALRLEEVRLEEERRCVAARGGAGRGVAASESTRPAVSSAEILRVLTYADVS